MVDESVKFAWAYLLTHGQLTKGEWSYYGSCWEYPTNEYGSYERYQKELDKIRERAISVGIDWDKTSIPTVSSEDTFNGTFASGGNCLATLGTLVLKNGKRYLMGSSDENAAHLAEAARQLLKGKSEIQELADKL